MNNVLGLVKEEGCSYVLMQSNNPAVQHIEIKIGLVESLKDMRIDFVSPA